MDHAAPNRNSGYTPASPMQTTVAAPLRRIALKRYKLGIWRIPYRRTRRPSDRVHNLVPKGRSSASENKSVAVFTSAPTLTINLLSARVFKVEQTKMETVPYLDLRAQYRPLCSEMLSALEEICESTGFAQGPATSKFEGEIRSVLRS